MSDWNRAFRAIGRLGFYVDRSGKHIKIRDRMGRIVGVTGASPSDSGFGFRKFLADFKRTTGIDLRKEVSRS